MTRTGARISLATPYMLAHAPSRCNADGTHKLTIADLNVLMFGFDDAATKFQPVMIVLSTTERHDDFKFAFEQWTEASKHLTWVDTPGDELWKEAAYLEKGDAPMWRPRELLADGSNAIKKGFLEVFGGPHAAAFQGFEVTEKNVLMCGNHLEAVRYSVAYLTY